MSFALPAKASLYNAASTVHQLREPRLAARRLNAMLYNAHAALSKVRLPFVIVQRYANCWGTLSGYAADSTAANVA